MRRSSTREVRHIIRQNGSLVEEIIAIRSGRLVKYVKKNSLGQVTCGSYRLANRQATEKKEKMTVTDDKGKEGLLDAILRVMSPIQKKKENDKDKDKEKKGK